MATITKKRFKEAELIDQNETQAQAIPATDAEVAQAAPTEAVPAVDETVPAEAVPAEEAVVPEGTEDAGVEVNPETVSVQVQIPVDQLGAAVAQATGDMEVANISPDVQAAQEEELVADNAVEGEDIPVEGATEEAPVEEGEELGQQLESKECGKDDKLTEESNPDYENGAKVAKDRCEQVQDMIDHAIDVEDDVLREEDEGGDSSDGESLNEFLDFSINTTKVNSGNKSKDVRKTSNSQKQVDKKVRKQNKFGDALGLHTDDVSVGVGANTMSNDKGDVQKTQNSSEQYKQEGDDEETLKEGIEDKVISEDPAEVVGDTVDDLPPGMDGEIEGDIDPALLDIDGEGDIPGLVGDDDFAIDEDDPAVQDFLSKIDGYLADEEAHPAQVADALRASADFFDAIDPEDEADDEDLLDVEEGDEEDDGEIPLDLDAIETNGAYSKTGDEVLDQFADVPEEEDYEESLVRVPCKFPKKRFGENKTARTLPLVRENKKIKEAVEDDFEEDGDWDVSAKFDRIVEEWGAEKTLNALFDFGLSNYPEIINDFIAEVEDGDISFFESKKVKADKLTEELDYSAVKFPAGSEEENMVEAYEKAQESRRKAIKSFRESVIKNNENHGISAGKSRFDEALRSSVRTSSRPSSNGKSDSWSNNRFVERMEEREELDFKALIRDGFLG